MNLLVQLCLIATVTCTVICDEESVLSERQLAKSRFKRAGDQPLNIQDVIPKEPLRVATVQHPPYMFINQTKPGRDKFTGFLPDLMFELSNRLGFQYQFYETSDKKFGSKKQDGSWTGMIGDLVKNKTGSKDWADIAAAGITITSARSRVVDFLQPFAHVTITAVIQKPHLAGHPAGEGYDQYFNLNFDIFKPLAPEVWILVTVLMVVVWLFTWLMNRYNPYEYGERHRRNLATEEQSELFNVSGSLWYTFTLLQWQGYDRAPRSIASKMLSCIWMGFVTVTLVTYIGSFVNYLFWASTVHTAKNPFVSPINDLKDLVNHKDGYAYGTLKNGATFQQLTQVSRGLDHHHMAQYWQSDAGKAQLVSSTKEGIRKVREGKYALLMESSAAKYEVNNGYCDLMTTGINIGMRSYGIAVRKDGYMKGLKEVLHNEVLELLELGVIDGLEERWFSNHDCWNATRIDRVMKEVTTLYLNQPQRVTIKMFWSPMVIMIVGIVLSVGVAVAEILWYKYRGRYDASNRQRGVQLNNEDDGHI